jgi:hypothetical protein
MGNRPPERDPEELGQQSWEYHRKRQLEALGIDPDDIDV